MEQLALPLTREHEAEDANHPRAHDGDTLLEQHEEIRQQRRALRSDCSSECALGKVGRASHRLRNHRVPEAVISL